MGPQSEGKMKAWSFIILWAFTILYLVSYTDAFSHGASLSACSDMRPKHIRAHLQNPQNNYITIHTNTSFSPGDKVPVTIRSSRDFMGFMLQARRVLNDQIAGTFVYIPPGSKLLTCFEDGDTVTHSDKSLKRNLSFVWKAPDQPIGDIRFFLSVVQSYFVYWANLESSTVSQQIQNKTITENNDVSSTIKPALLQELIDLKGTFTVGKRNSAPDAIVTPFAMFIPTTSLIRTEATLALDSTSHGKQASDVGITRNVLSGSFVDRVTSHDIMLSNGTEKNGGFTLESSLQLQDLNFRMQDYFSSANNRTETASSIPMSLSCLTCKKSIQETLMTPTPDVTKSAPPITTSPLVKFWDSPMPEDLDREENRDVYRSLSAVSRQEKNLKEEPMTQKVPLNFLPQAEFPTSGQETYDQKEVPRNTPLKVTRIKPQAAVSGVGKEKSHKESRLVAAQLGVLLGCSAVLGMILAVGLRCIHSQYCHKRTEVSFSEPDNNVIALQDSGEMMHFRKIRENSFVLVQAEYNWVSPSSSVKKAVM
ncbi:reelin domain-containing protein 1 isoform X2 [Ahaetulla prasina]|uniref:reelin domain-containing protein 1 isoform X2 n=1 Tax=Ahaetulla prasina TaxID=499056 RepID=UPI002647FFA1|nr:reelin domain-containing protein 1 isoform X2 [Ahaetulla prasina]